MEVELGYSLASPRTSIVDRDRDSVDLLPECRVSSLCTSSLRGSKVGGAVAGWVGIVAPLDGLGVVYVGVDIAVNSLWELWPGDLIGVWNSGRVLRDGELRGTSGRLLSRGLDGRDLSIAEGESGVAETKAEGVARSNVVLVKVLVVDIETFSEWLRDSSVLSSIGAGNNLDRCSVVINGLADSVRQLSTGRVISKENISEGASGFLSWEMGPDDGLDI